MPDPTLFDDLPDAQAPLPQDEAALLASLPTYDTVRPVKEEDEAACRRLEKRGLVHIHRWKYDSLSIRPTMYAGRID